MFRNLRRPTVIFQRTIKNFGHKRQPEPLITTIWLGFLTCTFIGCALEWRKMKNFLFGEGENFLEDSKEK